MTIYVYKLHEVVSTVYFVFCLSNSSVNNQKYNKELCKATT